MTDSRRPFTVLPSSRDENHFWFWDPSHFPRPVTPAAECFDLPAMASGFAGAARELRRPLAGQSVRVERGFVYFGIDLPPSAAALAAREAAYRATVDPLIGGALTAWQSSFQPRAESINAELRRLAAGPVVLGAIPTLLAAARALRAEQWRIHDRALVPAMEAVARFQAVYGERLGGVLAVHRLLQGFPNRATAAGEALESFAEAVRSRPRLADAIARGARSRPRTGSHDGDWFRGALADFLDAYGAKAEGWDVGAPTWAEDPRPVIAAIRERLRQGESEPGAHRRRAADDRERAVTAALASLPPDDRSSFLDALTAAQAYPVVSEDHNTVIDQQGMAALRAVLLAAGAVLAEHGAVARSRDIVWLTENEIARAAMNAESLARVPGLRRARHRRRLCLIPPRAIGAPLPAWAAHNSTLADFFGLGGEPESGAGRLHGTGASAGESTGRARVVRSLDEIDRLEAGDILVCPTTSPVWTPWLGLIAGAVVETGGVLSHTAVLAREYGVPCVTGVRDATRRIPNGALVRVDGTSGAVSWHDGARAEGSPCGMT